MYKRTARFQAREPFLANRHRDQGDLRDHCLGRLIDLLVFASIVPILRQKFREIYPLLSQHAGFKKKASLINEWLLIPEESPLDCTVAKQIVSASNASLMAFLDNTSQSWTDQNKQIVFALKFEEKILEDIREHAGLQAVRVLDVFENFDLNSLLRQTRDSVTRDVVRLTKRKIGLDRLG